MTTETAPAARRIWNPVQQDGATFLETAAESGGVHSLLEIDVAPGGGNELHRHLTYAEHFEVVSGRLTLQVGDATLLLGPGEQATAPIASAHCFRNETGRDGRSASRSSRAIAGWRRRCRSATASPRTGTAVPTARRATRCTSRCSSAWSDIGCAARSGGPPAPRPARARRAPPRLDRELRERYVRI
jgi:mannose-6-phosphate isomerase-like protein (cupin superfamily)